jgi:hypothetical protein
MSPYAYISDEAVEAMPEIGLAATAVLVALASHADKDREAFPSVARLSDMSGLKQRAVWYALAKLEDHGLIEQIRTPGGLTKYRLLGYAPACSPDDGGPAPGCTRPLHQDARGGASACSPPLHQDAHRTIPVNSTKNSTKEQDSSCRSRRFDESDMATAQWMHQLNLELQPERKAPSFEKWAETIRLMRERDERTDTQIRALYQWCHDDDFWRVIVLSPSKLRQKYDDLELRRTNGNGSNGTPGAGQRGRRGGPVRSESPSRHRDFDTSRIQEASASTG